MDNIILPTTNTWCPGCGNFGIQNSLKETIAELDQSKVVVITGIGCHGKIADYINTSSVYTIHGRTIPTATGMKMANPELLPICMTGDGDSYSEGISHLIHAAKANSNITVVVHDNRVFALTVNQFTPTSPEGYVSTTSPNGKTERPLNPIEMMLSVGATYVARGYSGNPAQLKHLITEGVKHQGFSFIEVLQPCVVWFNTFNDYNELVYEMESEDLSPEQARVKAREWDYNSHNPIPTGIFYREQRPTYEEQLPANGMVDVEALLEKSK